MAASYPSSAKTFTTKSNGGTIDASHINDLQEEVTAIEQDLLDGLNVTRGGTGVTSMTDRGVIIGRGSSSAEATSPGETGEALMGAGSSANPSFQRIARVLNRSAADVNNSGTNETDLKTYALSAGILSTNGDTIRITVTGITAANTNTKTLKVYFGATVVVNANITAADDLHWKLWAEITRTAAATQIACGTLDTHGSGSLFTTSAPTETLSGAITVKMTGQSNTASNDITAKNWSVEFLPNA